MFVFSCLQQKMGRISTVIFQTFILVDGKCIISECLFVLSIQTYLWMFLCCMHGFLVLKCSSDKSTGDISVSGRQTTQQLGVVRKIVNVHVVRTCAYSRA